VHPQLRHGHKLAAVDIAPKKRWLTIKFKDKRGITLSEHLAVVARESNRERRAFYQIVWNLGASK